MHAIFECVTDSPTSVTPPIRYKERLYLALNGPTFGMRHGPSAESSVLRWRDGFELHILFINTQVLSYHFHIYPCF